MPDDSPGLFSSLIGGLGGLLGYKDDPNAQQQDESAADYATRRQQARFGKMKEEVDGLLKKYPVTEEFPAEAFSEERRELRRRGFDQKEEDAIIHTFAITHGQRAGNLKSVLGGGSEEWQKQPAESSGGGGPGGTDDFYNRANPPLPPGGTKQMGPDLPRDTQVMRRLYENWNQSGREPNYRLGKDKRGRPMVFRDEAPGFDV